MKRLKALFEKKQNNILSIFFTAGYPTLESTTPIIKQLEKSGADLIEIGMPFSDPLADGPVIQVSSQKSLENGMTLKVLFNQLQDIRKEVSIPLILMGYINPILQYGVENFCQKCNEIGIDGLILPDLPMDMYLSEYKAMFKKYNLSNIFLITPQTSDERILQIDDVSNGFIYMVSSSSTTGARENIQNEQEQYFERIKQMKLKNPQLIGFGISSHETFKRACSFAHGAIIGSAFVKAVSSGKNIEQKVDGFIKGILEK